MRRSALTARFDIGLGPTRYDGTYGPDTKTSVVRVQTEHTLVATGAADALELSLRKAECVIRSERQSAKAIGWLLHYG